MAIHQQGDIFRRRVNIRLKAGKRISPSRYHVIPAPVSTASAARA